jgi:hypothetical protein
LVFVLVVRLLSVSTSLGLNAGKGPSLVGWWKLDDGAGMTAINSSGNGNHGTPVGASTFVSP